MDLGSFVRRIARAERMLFGTNVVLTAVLGVVAGAVILFPGALSSVSEVSASAAGPSTRTGSVSTAEVSKRTLGKAPFRTLRTTAPKVVDELSAFVLSGISERDGEKRAYVRDTKQKRVLTKRIGDSLGSYEIADIGPQGVSLTRGGQTVVLSRR